jgi:hypothetical protein
MIATGIINIDSNPKSRTATALSAPTLLNTHIICVTNAARLANIKHMRNSPVKTPKSCILFLIITNYIKLLTTCPDKSLIMRLNRFRTGSHFFVISHLVFLLRFLTGARSSAHTNTTSSCSDIYVTPVTNLSQLEQNVNAKKGVAFLPHPS